jgi:hypothetical protein
LPWHITPYPLSNYIKSPCSMPDSLLRLCDKTKKKKNQTQFLPEKDSQSSSRLEKFTNNRKDKDRVSQGM